MKVRELELHLEPSEVLRRLGYRRGAVPAAGVAERIERLRREAEHRLRPRGAYLLIDQGRARELGVPDAGERVAIGLCTIGPELEEEARSRGGSDRPLDALVFDAVGSAAAEAAADSLNLLICEDNGRSASWASPRISPGYGRWPVTSQPQLLLALPARELGVQLTDGGMMSPQKSVSFAVRFRSEPPTERELRHRCTRCGLVDCPYREEDHQ